MPCAPFDPTSRCFVSPARPPAASSSCAISSRRRARCRRSPRASCASSSGSARSSSTRSRWPAGTTTWCCSRASPATGASGPTTGCTTTAASTRPTTRASTSCPVARAAVVPLHLGPERDGARGRRVREHAALVEELLGRIRRRGPAAAARRSAPREAIDWYWRPTNQVRARSSRRSPRPGILGIARREGNLRVYDLAERLFPRRPPRRAASRRAEQRRHGCCRGTARTACSARRATRSCGSAAPGHGGSSGCGAAPARRGRRDVLVGPVEWCPRASGSSSRRTAVRASTGRVASSTAARPAGGGAGRRVPRAARPAVLGPRPPAPRCSTSTTSGRSTSPSAKRRWGYYVLPLLYGDRLVGRIEPRIERRAGDAPGPRPLVGAGLRPAGRAAGFVAALRRGARRAPRLRGPASGRASTAARRSAASAGAVRAALAGPSRRPGGPCASRAAVGRSGAPQLRRIPMAADSTRRRNLERQPDRRQRAS